VTIVKYIDGVKATPTTASSSSFQMNADFNDTTGTPISSGLFELDADGYATDEPVAPYQAISQNRPLGSDYGANEIIDGSVVGAVCATGTMFTLGGYTTGDTLEAAELGVMSSSSPMLINMLTDKFIIVWNNTCVQAPPVEPTPTATSTVVTIVKYVDGVWATASSSNSSDFPMFASFNATNTGSGSGNYALSASGYNGDPTPYQAKTVPFDYGADYATNEVVGGDVVGATCSSTQPYALSGYTTGNTLEEAQLGTVSSTSPAFTNMTSDKYVIVWNQKCSLGSGTIGGTVTGGATSTGVLAVTSVETVNSTGTANGTFESGWKYIFNITVPTNEVNLAMKFADWTSNVGSSTMPVANNLRISSAQSTTASSTVLITAANTYSTPALVMTGDLDLLTPGLQVKVLIETAIPVNSINGAYSTSYGVKTN
jgi:hypothetical protein